MHDSSQGGGQARRAGALTGTRVHHPLLAFCACRRKYAAYKELSQRQERQAKVESVASHLAYQKVVMGKGRKRKLGSKELKAAAAAAGQQQGASSAPAGPVFKWKRERQR